MQPCGPVAFSVGCAGEDAGLPVGGGPAPGGEEAVEAVLVGRVEGVECGVAAVGVEQAGAGGGKMVRKIAQECVEDCL